MRVKVNIRGQYPDMKFADSVTIFSDDGGELFNLYIDDAGGLEIDASGFVKHNDVVLDSALSLTARKGGNRFVVARETYEEAS